MLDNGDAAPEASVRLCELEAHIAAPEDDEVRGEPVEFQYLDMRERLGGDQARKIGNGGVPPHIEEHALACQHACAAVVQFHLEGFGRDEIPSAHNQLGATRPVAL
jgi:hypothetical protein